MAVQSDFWPSGFLFIQMSGFGLLDQFDILMSNFLISTKNCQQKAGWEYAWRHLLARENWVEFEVPFEPRVSGNSQPRVWKILEFGRFEKILVDSFVAEPAQTHVLFYKTSFCAYPGLCYKIPVTGILSKVARWQTIKEQKYWLFCGHAISNLSLRPNPDGRKNRKPDGRILTIRPKIFWPFGRKYVPSISMNLTIDLL